MKREPCQCIRADYRYPYASINGTRGGRLEAPGVAVANGKRQSCAKHTVELHPPTIVLQSRRVRETPGPVLSRPTRRNNNKLLILPIPYKQKHEAIRIDLSTTFITLFFSSYPCLLTSIAVSVPHDRSIEERAALALRLLPQAVHYLS
jgi:hypothetical protein